MPRKKTEIKASLNHCISFSVNGIWYESPKRILDTVEIISGYFPDIHLICAKELTKPYETYFRGSANDVYQLILSADLRGEWIVFVDGGSVDDDHTQQIASIAHQLHSIGLTGQQVKALAPLLNLPKNQLYEAYKVL